MTPGTYMKKRRIAAGLGLSDVVHQLVGQHEAIRGPLPGDATRLSQRLAQAEADQDNLTLMQAALVRRIYPFDGAVYEALLLRHYSGSSTGLPLPRICRECACSWNDPCRTEDKVCAWSDHHPNLCTACEARTAPPAAPCPESTEGAPAHG